MPEIKTIRLGDDVSVVRRKISMEAKDYSSLWRSINVSVEYDLFIYALNPL